MIYTAGSAGETEDIMDAALPFYFKVMFTLYLLPTLPYRSTQQCIVEQQMSDIDIRRQIWHLVAPIDWEGLLGESGVRVNFEMRKQYCIFQLTSMKFSRSCKLSSCPGNCVELVRLTTDSDQ